MAEARPLHGLLVVDKPGGVTSHDVVARARRLFGVRAVGHAGTLDPMATGVLVLLFGEACKLSAYLTGQVKRYVATVELGRGTDSHDRDGTTTSEVELPPGFPDDAALAEVLEREWRRTEQVPPAVSAISVGGRRAYALARKGQSVELAPRPVRVEQLVVLKREGRRIEVELGVSKGYYVRAFARDLGEGLGAPAHLAELRRTASGPFTLAEATRWLVAEPPALMSLAEAAERALPAARLTTEGTRKARLGQRLGPEDVTSGSRGEQPSCWFSPEGEVVAIGCSTADGFRVLRGLSER
jgi:tRNA pseudouridine55 synthase